MNVLQERPAPRYSGIVKHARDKGQKYVQRYIQLYIQSVNYANEQQVILTVVIGSEMLCDIGVGDMEKKLYHDIFA